LFRRQRLFEAGDGLTLTTGALTTRIVVENGRATGVEYTVGGKTTTANADREVIVAAGAIGSPKIMMLSGMGPADHLRKRGIDVIADVPGVGQNLQDHFDVDVVYELYEQNSFDKYAKPHWMLWAGIQYYLFGSGPVASNIVEGGAFWYTDEGAKTPDLQFHFLVGAGVEAGVPPPSSGAGLTLNTYFVRPRSRGSVSLRSADPKEAPNIDPNYVADPYDMKITVEGTKKIREIMTQPVFDKHIKKEHSPGDDVKTDAEFEEYCRNHGRTAYHPVGTCKMGIDDMAVVDPEHKVRGIDRLRICDSSVMPSLISSNTNAPSIMIAEKASDMIKASYN